MTLKGRRSVPRLSRLEYVWRVMDDFCRHTPMPKPPGQQRIPKSNIVHSVVAEGMRIEMERVKYTSIRRNVLRDPKKYESLLREGQAEETIRLMKRWNIIKPTDNRDEYIFDESENVQAILRSILVDPSRAREMLYLQAVASGERLLFPRNYVIAIRNSNVGSRWGLIAYGDFPSVLAKQMGTEFVPNPITMAVILDWMSYFKFSAHFREEGDVIVCTKAMASLSELWKLLAFLDEMGKENTAGTDVVQAFGASTGLNPFAARSVFECASAYGLLSVNISNVEQMLLTLGAKTTLLHQTEERVDASKDINNLQKPETLASTYVYTGFHPTMDRFYSELYAQYLRSVASPNDYAWTSKVSAELCKSLHIHPSTFNELFADLFLRYGPSLIESGEVYPDTLGKSKILVLPPKVGEQRVFKFRLRREKL